MQNNEKKEIERTTLLLGNNEFETTTLVLPAQTTLLEGALLKRSGNNMVPLPDQNTETPAAVLAVTEKNSSSTQMTITTRVVTSGSLNRGLLNVSGTPITDATVDKLRGVSIIPVFTTKTN